MKGQPNRLVLEARHPLAGHAIDRSRPLRFRLNGHRVYGFAGDTVLSAAIASGFDTVGMLAGFPIALGERFAPPVVPASLAGDRQRALPMARALAGDGVDLVTLPAAALPLASLRRAGRLIFGAPRSLGVRLEADRPLADPWLDIPHRQTLRPDLAVVGAGIAGMAAAVAAGRQGARVVLIERRPLVGGNAVLFGRTENEEGPEEAIARLSAALRELENVTLMRASEAFSLDGQRLEVHATGTADQAHAEIVAIEAPRIVLATGAVERLPVFPGNRLPGIVGTAEAFHLAHAYGVWPGSVAAFAAVSNPAYRLAMLAADAGIAVRRMLDARPETQSRFLEFCKAYAITMAGGSVLTGAGHARRRADGLRIDAAVSIGDYFKEEAPLDVQRLVVCGGWQPDLTLWHMGGGESAWHAERGCITASSGPQGVVLAGAAGGWLSTNACLQSGRDAVHRLFGRKRRPVRETVIDPLFDTPDGSLPVAPPPRGKVPPSYLDDGTSLTIRPTPPPKGFLARFGFGRGAQSWRLAEQPRALGIADVAAGVALGAIPEASAGLVAQERATSASNLVASARQSARRQIPPPAPPPPLVPDYLEGRFGERPEIWRIGSGEPRRLDPGSLIYVNSDEADPLRAMGVVLVPLEETEGTALALIGKVGATPGEGATLRDQGRPIPVRLLEPHPSPAPAPERADAMA